MRKLCISALLVFSAFIMSCGNSGGNDANATNSSSQIAPAENTAVTGNIKYVYATSGLNIRKTPALDGELVTKAPLGAKVEILEDSKKPVSMTYEGLKGVWKLVKYGTDQGYAFEGFLCGLPLPKAGSKLEDYMKKNFGPVQKVVTNRYNMDENSDLYGFNIDYFLKSGYSYRETEYYEGGETIYTFPGMTVQEAFVFLKQLDIPKLKNVSFPLKNSEKPLPDGLVLYINVNPIENGVYYIEFVTDVEWIKIEQADANTVKISIGAGL